MRRTPLTCTTPRRRQQQSRQFTARSTAMIQGVNVWSTAAQLQYRGRRRPAYAAMPSLVRYTNRPSGHQRRRTKRLVIVNVVAERGVRAMRSLEPATACRRLARLQ